MTVRVRSAMPGRIRLDVPSIHSRPAAAAALERDLTALDHAIVTKAKATTGSLLLLFGRDRDLGEVMDRVRSAIAGLESQRLTGSAPSRAPFRRVVGLAVGEPGSLAGPVAYSVISKAVNLVQNLSIYSALTVVRGESPRILRKLGITEPGTQLATLVSVSLALAATQGVIQRLRSRSWQRVARAAEHRLRAEVFEHLQQQDLSFFHHTGNGPLLGLVTQGVDSIGNLLEAGDGAVQTAVTIVVGGLALLRTSPRLALVIGGGLPLVLGAGRILAPQTKAKFAEAVPASLRLNQAVENILMGIVEVKSFTAEDTEAARLSLLSGHLAATRQAAAEAAGRQSTVIENSFHLSSALGMWQGARGVLAGTVEPSRFSRTAYWVPSLMSSFASALQVSQTYYVAEANSGELAKLLDSQPEIRSGQRRLALHEVRGAVDIQDVSFGYDGTADVLHHLSLRIPAGSSVGIVGPNGSGKTTLLRLLLRFYDPRSGRILLDTHDLRSLHIRDLRSSIGFVSQEVYLFGDTLEANIRYGCPNASPENVMTALLAAGGQALLESLPDGLGTALGEQGFRLSGGQRQRVALARALLKDAPILALDEATSHLDYEAEAAVKATLREACTGKTIILIAHRLSSIRDLDKIVVLDHGQVAEQGSHEELLDRRGLYHRLWALQKPS